MWLDHLINKKNCRSKVWIYFGFEPDERGQVEDRERPICRLCAKKVVAKEGNLISVA